MRRIGIFVYLFYLTFMKKLATILLFGVSFCSFGQADLSTHTRSSQESIIGSNIQRYNYEYKLVDESVLNADSTILSNLDLNILEYYRLPSEDVVVFDRISGLSIIAFSFDKIRSKNTGHTNYHSK